MQKLYLHIQIQEEQQQCWQDFFPQCPIYIITDNEITYRQMALLWNINPILVDKDEDIDKMINNGIEIAKKI